MHSLLQRKSGANTTAQRPSLLAEHPSHADMEEKESKDHVGMFTELRASRGSIQNASCFSRLHRLSHERTHPILRDQWSRHFVCIILHCIKAFFSINANIREDSSDTDDHVGSPDDIDGVGGEISECLALIWF